MLRPTFLARQSSDATTRWLALATETLAALASAERVVCMTADARGRLSHELVVADRATSARSAHEALADFEARFGDRVPLLPPHRCTVDGDAVRRWPPVVDAAAARELEAFTRDAGIVDVASLCLRVTGRVEGWFVLMRLTGQRPFQADVLQLVRGTAELLSSSYAAVLHQAAAADVDATDMLRAAGLSPRELDVARLVALGATNREISATLSRSPATISTHVTRLLAKLEMRNRTQLAHTLGAWAVEATASGD